MEMLRAARRNIRPAAIVACSAHRVEMARAKSRAAGGEAFAQHARVPTDERMRFAMNRAGAQNEAARDGITIGATRELRSPVLAIAGQRFAMQRPGRRGSRATV